MHLILQLQYNQSPKALGNLVIHENRTQNWKTIMTNIELIL